MGDRILIGLRNKWPSTAPFLNYNHNSSDLSDYLKPPKVFYNRKTSKNYPGNIKKNDCWKCLAGRCPDKAYA